MKGEEEGIVHPHACIETMNATIEWGEDETRCAGGRKLIRGGWSFKGELECLCVTVVSL